MSLNVAVAAEFCDEWPELEALDHKLSGDVSDIQHYKALLENGKQRLIESFRQDKPIVSIVRGRALLIDGILIRLWRRHATSLLDSYSLIAVGGYGRGELHPGSDIDVMILAHSAQLDDAEQHGIEQFLMMLWDIGLEVGHSLRTLEECSKEAGDDITVATSLMESRLLHGDEVAFRQMRAATGPESIWPGPLFFEAKLQEQIERHARHHDTASNLEPNIKGAPGGLRDIQMIGWVAKRHFGAQSLEDLVTEGFITKVEYKTIMTSQAFLWKLRFALHVLADRREERLLFDYQSRLAKEFGYKDKPHSLAVEQMMQRYYRTAMRVSRLNKMLLQLFREANLIATPAKVVTINEDFQILNNNLDVVDDGLFNRRPNALMEVFLHILEHDDITGVSARTIRLIRKKRNLINDDFRADPDNHATFLKILRAPEGVTHELRRMNLYGILGRFIPAFGKIVGLMQYDLFHAYTVDAHTLFVVSNLRRFALSRYNHEFPYCSQIMQSLPKPELAYLAGLFHDIAKGRGGDHSQLGAVDAEEFCLGIGLNSYEARLVAWLVRNHLELSVTAQKKDIHDPQVVNDFAAMVRDERHLKYLYVLTVADVRGTNPTMWNTWKAALFERLYRHTRRALNRGHENPIDREELIDATREQATLLLNDSGMNEVTRIAAWGNFDETYFLRHSASEIAWHTQVLAQQYKHNDLVVAARQINHPNGGSLMVLAPRVQDSFPKVTAVLEQLGLTILDARVTNVARDFNLDTYRILSASTSSHDQEQRATRIERAVLRAFENDATPKVTRPASRAAKVFTTATDAEFTTDTDNKQTILEITAADRPGLLSRIGQAFVACDVLVTAAKITTVGERAEDVFYLNSVDGSALSEATCAQLKKKILDLLPSSSE